MSLASERDRPPSAAKDWSDTERRPSLTSRVVQLLRILRWDLAARLKHGTGAPRKFQRLWVDPRAIALRLEFPGTGRGGRMARGAALGVLRRRKPAILDGDWDLASAPLGQAGSVNAMVQRRLATGLSWEEVGEVRRTRRLLGGRAGSEADLAALVAARYRDLDALIEHVRGGGEILPQTSLRRMAFREMGGIEFAIDRHGQFLRVGEGNHRLAIAQHFGLPRIPACLLAVHAECVASGRFRAILVDSERLRRLAPPGALGR
jgi:hypothetical protein